MLEDKPSIKIPALATPTIQTNGNVCGQQNCLHGEKKMWKKDTDANLNPLKQRKNILHKLKAYGE